MYFVIVSVVRRSMTGMIGGGSVRARMFRSWSLRLGFSLRDRWGFGSVPCSQSS